MIKTLLITGCTHGLGKALAIKFAQIDCIVYAVGRDEVELEKLSKYSNFIRPIQADILTSGGKQSIIKQVGMEPLSIIHNAAIVKPIQFNNLTHSSLQEHFETNLYAPLLLTQQLLPLLTHGQRVLNISSGAADLPLQGLLPYCTTKSALEFATRCLNSELNSRGVYCASLRPGMIDTPMQENLRNTNKDILPNQEFYVRAKNENTLIHPAMVAEFVIWTLMKTNDEQFSETSWNIHDKTYQSIWLKDAGYPDLFSLFS